VPRFLAWNLCSVKPGIQCLRLSRAAGRARRTRSFVYALVTMFVSSIEARQPRAVVHRRCSSVTRPSQLKKHSTLKSHCRWTKNRSELARHASSSRVSVFVLPRAATWYRLCEAKERTLAQRQPSAIDTRIQGVQRTVTACTYASIEKNTSLCCPNNGISCIVFLYFSPSVLPLSHTSLPRRQGIKTITLIIIIIIIITSLLYGILKARRNYEQEHETNTILVHTSGS
jgi:hypothetical protein